MSDTEMIEKKKIPKSIMAIGTFQSAVGLGAITFMAITGDWNLLVVILAVGYTALGAGLLAILEWARFGNVVIHPMILMWLLIQAASGQAGFATASQVAITLGIFYLLTRPEIRALFRRECQQN
ncbi:MAG: hypothetical protein AAF629_28505 [Chloroflexota bacterium]